MVDPENQTPPKKRAPKKPKRGGTRPGAGRPKRAAAPPGENQTPAAPPAPGENQSAPPENQSAAAPPGENQTPPASDPFGPRAAGDPHAELRKRIARNAPEFAPITVGLVAPLASALVAHYTGCDLSKIEVRARVVSRTGEPRGHTCAGTEALGLALAQLAAAALPDIDELAGHPLSPALLTLAGVALAVGGHALAVRQGADPAVVADVLSRAAAASAAAERAASAPPGAIPPDEGAPGISIDEAMS